MSHALVFQPRKPLPGWQRDRYGAIWIVVISHPICSTETTQRKTEFVRLTVQIQIGDLPGAGEAGGGSVQAYMTYTLVHFAWMLGL